MNLNAALRQVGGIVRSDGHAGGIAFFGRCVVAYSIDRRKGLAGRGNGRIRICNRNSGSEVYRVICIGVIDGESVGRGLVVGNCPSVRRIRGGKRKGDALMRLVDIGIGFNLKGNIGMRIPRNDKRRGEANITGISRIRSDGNVKIPRRRIAQRQVQRDSPAFVDAYGVALREGCDVVVRGNGEFMRESA